MPNRALVLVAAAVLEARDQPSTYSSRRPGRNVPTSVDQVVSFSPYDVGMFIPGTHGNGALLAQVVLTRAVSFADDFGGARAYAGVSATPATVLDVHRNGSPIGTITFGIGATTGTFATAGGGAETSAGGDRLSIINQDPADATLADLSITFLGKRT
jgi:hypothetical protein